MLHLEVMLHCQTINKIRTNKNKGLSCHWPNKYKIWVHFLNDQFNLRVKKNLSMASGVFNKLKYYGEGNVISRRAY